MYSVLDIDGSGMTAHKEWMETISNNLANINTTRTNSGGPYKRQTVEFESTSKFDTILNREVGSGVRVKQIVQDNHTKMVYDPQNPDADKQGYVQYPEIDMTSEMTDMLMAQRGYEANATALSSNKQIIDTENQIGKV
jgi:flagellar basal-body rod protein FlgC